MYARYNVQLVRKGGFSTRMRVRISTTPSKHCVNYVHSCIHVLVFDFRICLSSICGRFLM